MVETLGVVPNRTYAEIPYERFAETFRVSVDWVSNALGRLEEAGFIRIGRSDRGQKTYGIREEYIMEAKNAGRQTVRGRCPDCKTVGEFSTEFIPTPHIAFRKLGGCVDSATFRCTMVVARYTCQWDRENRCLAVKPSELNLDDFVRLVGLEKREITNGLSQAVKLGIVGRELRQGKPSLFWLIPEGIAALERREPKTVEQPKEKAKPEASENAEKVSKQEPTHANESGPYLYGRCANCKHLVTVEPVSEEEFSLIMAEKEKREPDRPPRAGPTRAGTAKPTKWEETKKAIWEMFVAK